ncbi:MAG: hypothetical protein ACRECL_09815 [Bradyrhizobium sp.]
MEVLTLERACINPDAPCVRFPTTKSGAQLRAIGRPALKLLLAQPSGGEENPYVFPSETGDGHFVGVVRVLQRLCLTAKLEDVTPHVLRHTFASVAGDLGFSELTVAGPCWGTTGGASPSAMSTSTRLCSCRPTRSPRRSNRPWTRPLSDGTKGGRFVPRGKGSAMSGRLEFYSPKSYISFVLGGLRRG